MFFGVVIVAAGFEAILCRRVQSTLGRCDEGDDALLVLVQRLLSTALADVAYNVSSTLKLGASSLLLLLMRLLGTL